MIIDESFKSMVYGMVTMLFHLKVDFGELDEDAHFEVSKNKDCILVEWHDGFTEELSPSGPNGETTIDYEPKVKTSKIYYSEITKNSEELCKAIQDEVDIIANDVENAYMKDNFL